ncbi:hypothetical protein BH24DEI2_BH24DEI2_05130 [soil metagenome]
MTVALTEYPFSRSGIAQAWLVDLGNDEMLVYRDPSLKGYELVRTHGLTDKVSLSAFDLTLRVGDVLLRSS